jgi:transcriptional pleiotropic repressor
VLTMTLTERARMINRLLQHSGAQPVDFEEMAAVLGDAVGASVFVIGRSGKVLGHRVLDGAACVFGPTGVVTVGEVGEAMNRRLLEIQEERINDQSAAGRCLFDETRPCDACGPSVVTVIPVVGGGQRLGTLFLWRHAPPFSDEDVVLAEFGATVVGMEILRSKTLEIEQEARQKAAVQVAIGSLSFSELEAVQNIMRELDGQEGLLVASRIADRIGITRSVIVNALRKFESAGVIDSRSLGMKGTYIRVLNEYLLPELDRVRLGG